MGIGKFLSRVAPNPLNRFRWNLEYDDHSVRRSIWHCNMCGLGEHVTCHMISFLRLLYDVLLDCIEEDETLYILSSVDQELPLQAQERVTFLPHYDTICLLYTSDAADE